MAIFGLSTQKCKSINLSVPYAPKGDREQGGLLESIDIIGISLLECPPMDAEDFLRLTKLSRLSLSEEEKAQFIESLNQILVYIDLLKDIPTDGIPPCSTVLESLSLSLREDIPGDILSRDLFLENTPAHIGGMVRVPTVLKQE